MSGAGSDLLVVAIGGNALAPSATPGPAGERDTLRRTADLVAAAVGDRPAVITHGNGPQVGRLAAATASVGGPDPLDVLDAASQGELGHLLLEALSARPLRRPLVAVLTRVVVDPSDPAFRRPTKPVGPPVAGAHRARVASPEPIAVPELPAIRLLVDAGWSVVAAGGGGIPVAPGPEGGLAGVAAVVDKDLTSSLLAVGLDAARLVILTDVDAVLDPGDGSPLGTVSASTLVPGRFEAGTMRPKVEAAVRFVRATGRTAVIGSLQDADRVAAGTAGTRIVP